MAYLAAAKRLIPHFQHPSVLHFLSHTSILPWSGQYATYSGKPMKLRSTLRSLYKRVHPDLFTDYPAEKLENEHSFKLLQDYIRQAEEGDPASPAARTPYHFCFYLRDEVQSVKPSDLEEIRSGAEDEPPLSDAESDSDSDSAQEELRCVQLSLPPPPAGSSSSSSGYVAPAVRTGLNKLLRLCGVDATIGAGAGDEEEEGIGARQLCKFLPAAAEVVRLHESGEVSSEVRVANLRGALRLLKQVVVGFSARDFSGPQQVELLERFARALDQLPDINLAGLHVLIGHRTALDPQGFLCLDAQQSSGEWVDFLGGVDLEYARQRRQLAAAVKRLEQQVAAALGCSQVFTAAGYLMSHQYREFLERLASHAALHGPAATTSTSTTSSSSSSSSGSSSDAGSSSSRAGAGEPLQRPVPLVPVLVVPVAHPGSSSSSSGSTGAGSAFGGEASGFSVSPELGYIQVPMGASAGDVHAFIKAHAAAAAAVLSAKQHQAEQLEVLTNSTRQRLRLRRLLRDELVSPEQYTACCQRLVAFREELLQHLEGMSVRVALVNRVVPGGQLVDVAWNFEV